MFEESFFYTTLRGHFTPQKRTSQSPARKPTRALNLSLDHSSLAQSVQTTSLDNTVFYTPKRKLIQKIQKPIREPSPSPIRQEEEIILIDHTRNQPDVILEYLHYEHYSQEKHILKKWICTLPQDIRKEIEVDKKYFPIPRNIDEKSIKQGLNVIYGVGRNRRLRPGEEALIMETIRKHFEQVLQDPALLNYSVATTIQNILKTTKHEMNDMPFCMKQVELHYKMMATRFRYSDNPQIKTRKMQKFLQTAAGRGHFIDLRKKNILVNYLLKPHQF